MHIRPFEIVLIGTFAVIALTGLIFLAAYQTRPSDEEMLYGDRVLIWGTLDQEVMNDILTQAAEETDALRVVSYRQIDEETFEDAFVNEVAEGRSPDLLLIPHTLLVSLRTKLTAISYQTLPERSFKDAYIDGADIFMRSDGVYGIPLAVDPLVMYWNRDIFSSAGLAEPPRTWETLVAETVEATTQLNDSREIVQSGLAFGEYRNVSYAKEILSMLFLQTGNSIVEERGGQYVVTFGDETADNISPGDAVLNFYTQFASPTRSLYAWNRSKPVDRSEFLGGKLGMYFGLGSEWRTIEGENPNLNYDMARVPQGAGATTLRTYGEFYAFAIPRASERTQGAYAFSLLFSSPKYAQLLADGFDLAPAHRALHGGTTDNPFKDILYQSALIARGWLDPAPEESEQVFQDMVESVTSGGARQGRSVTDAVHALEALF